MKKVVSSTCAQKDELKALASMTDDAVDTSDIAEVTDWSGAKRGLWPAAGSVDAELES